MTAVQFFVNRTERRERVLTEAQIPFATFLNRGRLGLLISENEIRRAIDVMGIEIEEEVDSDYEGIVILRLVRNGEQKPKDRTQKREIVFEFDDLYGLHEYMRSSIDMHLTRFKGKEVRLSSSHKEAIPPVEGRDKLFIRIGCASTETRSQGGYLHETVRQVPNVLFGYRTFDTLGYWEAWSSSGKGLVISDPQGVEVAELIGNNLYIFYPLTHNRFSSSREVFNAILKEAGPWIGLSDEQRAERKRFLQGRFEQEQAIRDKRESEARTQRKPKARQDYVAACSFRFKRALESAQTDLNNSKENVERLQAELTKQIRIGLGAERKIRQMRNESESMDGVYAKEFDKISSMPKILEVLPENGVIKIFTDTLFCVDPRTKKKHEIGRFRIEIQQDGDVKWFNMTRRVVGMNAPHVNGEGDACLGSVQEIIPELAGNYEFAALATVCIQFIESVNVNDDWGRHVSQWPVAA